MNSLPNQDSVLRNFASCNTWEEKYLYIIELGEFLPPLPICMRKQENLIANCQSQVWIIMTVNDHSNVQLYGDSDAAIVKGFIAMIFILYRGLTPSEIMTYDVKPFFNTLMLMKHLTPSRSQGLEAIVRSIRILATARK